MATPTSLLCIHRDPSQLSVLKEKGYVVMTATNGSQGLRLLMSQSVDAVILEYHLGLLDGAVVADEIRQIRPRLPIVMLADRLELPQDTLKSVDVIVAKSDGPRVLLETIHSVLQTSQTSHRDGVLSGQAMPPDGETMPNPSKRQIFVVDDDPDVRECVAMLLTSAGYDVVVAEDGFRALSQLRKTQPDLIVSDLDMPGMSGFELLSVVRRRFPQILTVAMSGECSGDRPPFGVIADAFFAKGSQSKDLFKTLRELFRTAPVRSSEHYRERTPSWIPRNGNDSQGMPYVVVTCGECLRAFPMNLVEGTSEKVLEVPCRFCASANRYIIQPSSQHAPAFA